jgi:hypothetical protein
VAGGTDEHGEILGMQPEEFSVGSSGGGENTT